jgi:hypothetical protein
LRNAHLPWKLAAILSKHRNFMMIEGLYDAVRRRLLATIFYGAGGGKSTKDERNG